LAFWAGWELVLKIGARVSDFFYKITGRSKEFREEMYRLNTANAESLSPMNQLFDSMGNLAAAQAELGRQQDMFTDPKKFAEWVKGFITGQDKVQERLNAYEQALKNVELAEEKRAEVLAKSADNIYAVAQADKDLAEAEQNLANIEQGLDLLRRRGTEELTAYEQAQDALTTAQNEYRMILDDTTASALAVESAYARVEAAGENLKKITAELSGEVLTLDDRLAQIRQAATAGGFAGIFAGSEEAVEPFLRIIEEAVGGIDNLREHGVLMASDVVVAMGRLEVAMEDAQMSMIEAGEEGSEEWQRLHVLFELLMGDLEDLKASFEEMSEVDQAIESTFGGMEDLGVNAIKSIGRANDMLISGMVKKWRTGEDAFKSIFENISDMFITLVLQAILDEAWLWFLPKLKLVFAIFDKRSNDLMAIQVGKDYMKYVMQGIESEMGATSFAPNIPTTATAPAASTSVTVTPQIIVNEPSPLTTVEFVDNKVDPRLRQLQKSRTESL